MCGYLVSNSLTCEDTFMTALATISYRGPDHSGFKKSGNWLFGHVRLSLFDLTDVSNQPVKVNNAALDDIVFVFNGEIFNFKDFGDFTSDTLMLKSVLPSLIHDGKLSETMLKTFLNQWNGFFSLTIKVNGTIYFIRDRFGEKPLYLYKNNAILAAGSEIKAIRAMHDIAPSPADLHRLCEDPFDFQEADFCHGLYRTVFESVFEVKPGYLLSYQIDNNVLIGSEWYNLQGDIDLYGSEVTEDLILDAVKLRVASDAKGAFTLSGGVDSSANCALAKLSIGHNVDAYSIISAKIEYSELETIEQNKDLLTSQHSKIFESDILKDITADQILDMLRHFDYPYFDANIVQHSLYSEIKKKGNKFVIDGHGADELMSGYQWHIPNIAFFAFIQGRPKTAWDMMSWFVNSYPLNYPLIYKVYITLKGFLKSLLSIMGKQKYFGNTPKSYAVIRYQEVFSRVLLRLLNNYDMTSMRNSIEVRTPFLDFRLVANILAQENQFFEGKQNKQWLRDLLRKVSGVEVMNRKIGLGSYIWDIIANSEKEKLYEMYLTTYLSLDKKSRFRKNKPIKLKDLNTLNPVNQLLFWKVLSFGVLMRS